jgi:hypothetical protein
VCRFIRVFIASKLAKYLKENKLMGILGDDDSLLGSTPSGTENNYAASLGRISGKALEANLLRQGVDLAFDGDLLYLKVSPQTPGTDPAEDGDPNYPGVIGTGIGINRDVPVYDLDVNSDIFTRELTVTNQLSIDNIVVNVPNTFTTTVGGIDIFIAGSDIYHDRLTTANLEINDNYIASFSNANITLDPAGTGIVQFIANTNITGNLTVGTALAPRNINISGDLSKQGNLILGDRIIDTVTINTDFAQSIIPGDDLRWSLGENTGDSSPRRWAELHSPDWASITTGAWPGSGLRPQTMTVSDQMSLNGFINKISAVQSNEDIALLPNTGIVYIESTKWQDSNITNLLNTPLTLGNTGIGYTQFAGTDAMVFPAGDNSQRRLTPEVGETRWNTEIGYLECFDGSVWEISTGGGEEVTNVIMEDLGHAYTLILG